MIFSFLGFLHLKWTRSNPLYSCVPRVAWCRQVQTLSYHPVSQRKERLVCCLSAGNRTFFSCSVVFPPVPKTSLIFKILGLLYFLNPQTLTFFSVLLPRVFSLICSLTTSFASSVFTFLNLDPKIYSPFLCLSEKTLFLIAHFPLLPPLSWLSLYLAFLQYTKFPPTARMNVMLPQIFPVYSTSHCQVFLRLCYREDVI